jgi:hypothetical protein
VHRELKEYIEANSQGCRYSRFLRTLPQLGGKALGHDAPDPLGGDKLVVDFAGGLRPQSGLMAWPVWAAW